MINSAYTFTNKLCSICASYIYLRHSYECLTNHDDKYTHIDGKYMYIVYNLETGRKIVRDSSAVRRNFVRLAGFHSLSRECSGSSKLNKKTLDGRGIQKSRYNKLFMIINCINWVWELCYIALIVPFNDMQKHESHYSIFQNILTNAKICDSSDSVVAYFCTRLLPEILKLVWK